MSLRKPAWLFPLLLLDCFILFVLGQTQQNVTVGQFGSFFNPATISAGQGDTITFIFLGPFHTVTQSSAENPCLPLPGGFDSGVQGTGVNTNEETSTWSLKITNASQPIWYFCQLTQPTSHCGSGMVGVINPPSQAAYTQVRMLAERVSGTPTPSPTLILTGIGAAASVGPIPVPLSSTSSPSAPTSPSHLGAIIGGAVGGFFALLIIVLLLAMWTRRRKALGASTRDTAFFDYTPNPVRARRPSEAFVAAKALENSAVPIALPVPRPPRPPAPQTAPLSPNRRNSVPGVTVVSPDAAPHDREASVMSYLGTATAPSSDLGSDSAGTTQTGGVNMQALAQEVAAVLLRAPGGGVGLPRTSSGHLRDDSRGTGGYDPPAYRMSPAAAPRVGLQPEDAASKLSQQRAP